MPKCQPCTMDYSKGNGTGVADALGNWGFSSEVASPGHELSRMNCLLERMDALKSSPSCSPSRDKKKSCRKMCKFEHSPPECRPVWMFWQRCPLVTFTSVDTRILVADKKIKARDELLPIPERGYCVQGDDKWYKLGPLCCPQPSCPAPCCPAPASPYCCGNICC